MAEEPFKLLIMDSITANLRVDFSGRGELADRQQKLGQMMARLRKVTTLLLMLHSGVSIIMQTAQSAMGVPEHYPLVT